MGGGVWWAAVHGVAKSRTRIHFHFSLSWIGEGNGNPLQCSCLKNPRDGAAWWAAVYGVAQSRTRLKQQQHARQQKKHRLGLTLHSCFRHRGGDLILLLCVQVLVCISQAPQGPCSPS